MVVISRKPLHSVLYLILCLFTIAGHYFLIHAKFLVVLNLILGPAVVLLLNFFFVLRFENREDTRETRMFWMKTVAVSVAGLGILVIVNLLNGAKQELIQVRENIPITLQTIINLLIEKYLLPFEMISLILLGVLTGVVLFGFRKFQKT